MLATRIGYDYETAKSRHVSHSRLPCRFPTWKLVADIADIVLLFLANLLAARTTPVKYGSKDVFTEQPEFNGIEVSVVKRLRLCDFTGRPIADRIGTGKRQLYVKIRGHWAIHLGAVQSVLKFASCASI